MIAFANGTGETCWDKSTFYPAQFGAFSMAGTGMKPNKYRDFYRSNYENGYTDWSKEGFAGYSGICESSFHGCKCGGKCGGNCSCNGNCGENCPCKGK